MPALHPFVRQLGSFFVEEAAPGFGGFSGVAVGAEGDSVEDSVVAASDSWDAVVELEVDFAEVSRVVVGVGWTAGWPVDRMAGFVRMCYIRWSEAVEVQGAPWSPQALLLMFCPSG